MEYEPKCWPDTTTEGKPSPGSSAGVTVEMEGGRKEKRALAAAKEDMLDD
jgi:hypothetical protein